MQFGTKLFSTDEAILSSDWISNIALINAYDMHSGEYFFINRAYAAHRLFYQNVVKEAGENADPNDELQSKMSMYREEIEGIFNGVKQRIEFGKLLPFSKADPIVVEKSTATREGEPAEGDQLVEGYTIQKVAAMTSTGACGFRKSGRFGKGGGNWGKGYGRGGFVLQLADVSTTQIQGFPRTRCTHPICRYNMVDGHLKCPQCHRQLEPVTDANVATEVARREAMARTKGIPFSMDRVIFHHPRRARFSARAAASGSTTALRHRSSYGLLRDMAKKYVKAVYKRGFVDVVDRSERDPFFQFNCANQDLGPEALRFIERLAGAISPTFDRTKEQVLGERLDYATKIVFVPSRTRQKYEPLDLHKEVFISHRGVFLDIGQFAVYVAKILKPKDKTLPLVYGWKGTDFVPDADNAEQIAKDLIEYSKIQWTHFAAQQAHHEPEATGEDEAVALPHAGTNEVRHERPRHEQFEPNLNVKGRQGPYEGGKGSKGHGKGKGQGKQGKGYGKHGTRPPGGVTYYDFVGNSGWDHGYRYTWYWNERRGWFWRWDQ